MSFSSKKGDRPKIIRVFQCKLCGWSGSSFGDSKHIDTRKQHYDEVNAHLMEAHPELDHGWGVIRVALIRKEASPA